MSAGAAYCPYCRALVPYGTSVCPNCYKALEECRKCGVFLIPGQPTCWHCGESLAMEPQLSAKIWVEGGGIVGDTEVLKVVLENKGVISTDVTLKLECPENIDPPRIEDAIKDLIPGQPVQRAYQFSVNAPGTYIIENIEITYTKSSREIEYLPMKPVKFVIYGRPIVQLSVEKEENYIKLGDTIDAYVILKNVGTEPALFVKVEIAFPTSVYVSEPTMTLAELKPDEERIAVVKIRPLFSGEHICKIRSTYMSPALGPIGSTSFESLVKTLTVIAELREKKIVRRKEVNV
jgi:RNA polymerase subunit RPABC4/transcription elongation factor Spt4